MGPVTTMYMRLRATHSQSDLQYFIYEVGNKLDMVRSKGQQDAQEFLRGLFEIFNKENSMQWKGEKSPPAIDYSRSVKENWTRFVEWHFNQENSAIPGLFGG